MLPIDIRRWRVADIESVFGLCNARQQTCEAFGAPLESPSVFDSWTGSAAAAAKNAGNAHRDDINTHGAEVAQVGRVAKQAATEVQTIINRLTSLERAISVADMELEETTGKVKDLKQVGSFGVATDDVDEEDERLKRAAIQTGFQNQANQLMQDADAADRDLAVAVDGATGQIPINQVRASVLPNNLTHNRMPGVTFQQTIPKNRQTVGPADADPTKQTRYIPMTLPKGWTDDPKHPKTDIGRQLSGGIRFDPNDPRAKGNLTSTLGSKESSFGTVDSADSGDDKLSIPYQRKASRDGFPLEGPESEDREEGEREGALDLDYQSGMQLRADSATPTAMREVTVNGQQYLAVDYQYHYSGSKVTVAGVNGVDLPYISKWHPMSDDAVRQLYQDHGVPAPTPGG